MYMHGRSPNERRFSVEKRVNGGVWMVYSAGLGRLQAKSTLAYGKGIHASRCPKDSVEWRISES